MKKPIHKAAVKSPVRCQDGPLKNTVLWLDAQFTTFVFTIKGETGFYAGGKWNAVP